MDEDEMEVDMPLEKGSYKLSRGEKSKIAAKCRRDKENIAMNQLIDELPVSNELLNKMDKAAVVKLAISFIKIKHYVQKELGTYGNKAIMSGAPPSSDVGEKRLAEGKLMLEALNGFLIFVSKKGTIKFISNTVYDHLGLKQEKLMCRNILEFIHVSDQQEFHKHFRDDKGGDPSKVAFKQRPTGKLCDEPQRVFYLRMKFNLPKPGTRTKHSGYLLVQWSGKMKRHISSKTGQCVIDGLLCICRPMQTTPLLEIRMDGNMFMSRHDLGMTFTFCDTRIITLTGYEPNELLGKTAYHFHNPIDAPKVSDCHQKLIVKGTSVSKYYRFLGKNDNWVWLQTRATIIYNTNNQPQYIVCMNYVISEEEGERYLMLEEHQNANKQTDNTILTLPDNQHHDPISQPPETMGPRIVELEEDHLIQTARYPSTVPLQGSQQMAPDNQQMAQPSPGSDTVTDKMMRDVDQVSTTNRDGFVGIEGSGFQSTGVSGFMPAADSDILDLNTPVDSPDTSTGTMSNNGSPQSASSVDAGGMSYVDQCDDGYSGPVSGRCRSNYSNTDSDPGYASADSPHSGHYSPQIISPGCSTERGSAFGTNFVNATGYIQGQNCQLNTTAFGANGTSHMSGVSPAVADVSNADSVLDNLLDQLNSRSTMNNDLNIEDVFSTYQNVISQAEIPLSTSVQNPGLTNRFTPPLAPHHQQQQWSPPSNTQNKSDKKSSSFLRSILTMPEKDLAKTCSTKQGSHSVNQGCSGQQINFSAQTVMSPRCNKTDSSLGGLGYTNSVSGGSTCPEQPGGDIVPLGFSGIPDDISDFAMQYLVDDTMDTQAQAIINDIQSVGDGTTMDTSDDLTRVLLNSLENQCASTTSQTMGGNFNGASGGMNDNIPVSLSSSCLDTNSQYGCAGPSRNNNYYFPGTSRIHGNSSHDHVYHQNVNRSRSQKIQADSMYGSYRQTNSCGSNLSNCASQTQTSEYCLSELRGHLQKHRRTDRYEAQTSGDTSLSTSPKPFLEQLLTGELTKDMYMTMERKRFQDGSSLPK